MAATVEKNIGSEIETAGHCTDPDMEQPAKRAAGALVEAFEELAGGDGSGAADGGLEFDANGFRGYEDHFHFEISGPLVLAAASLVLLFREARRLFQACKERAERKVGPIRASFNISSRFGRAWGHHLNVLIARSAFDRWREADWAPLLRQWVPFIVTSPPLLGTGKVGAENEAPDCSFQLTQRFDFITELIGWETVSVKNFINTRDEALADRELYSRLHMIWSDGNVLEFALFLKAGLCQVLLALIEEGYPLPDLRLRNPLDERHPVGRDLSFRHRLELADGRTMTALEIQSLLCEAASKALSAGCAANAVPDATRIVALWSETLDDLANRHLRLGRRLDWFAKLQILRRLEASAGGDADALVSADLRFAELGGFFEELERAKVVDRLEDFLGRSVGVRPVLVPRERLRAALIERFADRVVRADWDWLVLRSRDGASLWEIELDFDSAASCLRALEASPTPAWAFARLKELGFLTRYQPPAEDDVLDVGVHITKEA